MEEQPSLLSGLPKDALTHSVSFLPTTKALALATLNSSFRQALCFSALQDPGTLFQEKTWNEQNDLARRSVWIPVLFPHLTHSVVLSCKWRDQGWGNQKGTLFVVAVPDSDDPNEETLRSIDNGTIVYQSPLAPHTEESLQISFSYSPDKAYYLWYRVGGGGGHQLRITNLSMRTVIHDHDNKWIGRNYDKLRAAGFLESLDAFSLDMLSSIAKMGQVEGAVPVDMEGLLVGFSERNGLDMSAASMKALEEVATALQEQELLKVARASLPPSRNERSGVAQIPLVRERGVEFRDIEALMARQNDVHRAMAEAGQMMEDAMANQQELLNAVDESDDSDMDEEEEDEDGDDDMDEGGWWPIW